MMADWEGLTFELGTWKNTGTYILKGEQHAHAVVRVMLSQTVVSILKALTDPQRTPPGWLVGPILSCPHMLEPCFGAPRTA